MTAYYNEIDPYAAQWLRNLIAAGHIAPGDVDERSIEDVKPSDLYGYTQCHFFAGAGVWSAALRRSGWGDDRPVWTASCPCQPFSAAGKGLGAADERHLWPAFFHLFTQCNPDQFFGEQVASKDGLAWLDLVQTDLEGAGYTSGAVDMCAAGVGAPHIRQRLWIVAERMADSESIGSGTRLCNLEQGEFRRNQPSDGGTVDSDRQPSTTNGLWRDADWLHCRDGKWRPVEPGTFPLANGAAQRVGRLRAYGNAINLEAASEFIAAYLQS